MNPSLGHEVEPESQVTPAAIRKKIMVVGAGPAGMECAITAKRRGHDVVVFERSDRIGGSLIGYATHDLAHKEDLASVVSYYEVMARKLGIEVRFNTEVTPKLMRSLLHQFDAAVVATGARIDLAALPAPEVLDTLVTAHDVALGRVTPGRNIVVIGGGKIGLALAESLKSSGHDVAVVESEKRIAGDVMPSWKWRHTAWVEELDIPVFTMSRVVRIGDGGVTLLTGKGEECQVPADTVIAAAPSRGNQELVAELEWSIDELHVCGDSVVPRGLTQAIHDGYRLGCRL